MAKIFVFFLLCVSVCFAGKIRHKCRSDDCYNSTNTIIRPCDLRDYQCIGDNLAANSYCNPEVKGHIDSRYVVEVFRFEAQNFNCTYYDKDLIVVNHDKCYVTEFYVNMDTDKAVITVDCPYLYLESDRELKQHHTACEDDCYYYHIKATYPRVRMTAILPTSTHMDLCQANVFTDVTTLPIMHIDPQDEPTDNYLSKDLSRLNIFERENFFYRGYPLIRIFIDSYICNYGCPPHIWE